VKHGQSPIWVDGPTDFPDPSLADERGLLAVGGDLSAARLLAAYRRGIFPWPLLGEGGPILWFSPDPRFVLAPRELHVPRSLERRRRRRPYAIRFDSCFGDVVRACATASRPGQRGTWITGEMMDAYDELHRLGYAHSVEAFAEGELVGGLYGVSLGGAFFGESMFARAADASKLAFVELVERLARWDFALVDCQVETDHLSRFGALPLPRARFLRLVARSAERPDRVGSWSEDDAATAAARTGERPPWRP